MPTRKAGTTCRKKMDSGLGVEVDASVTRGMELSIRVIDASVWVKAHEFDLAFAVLTLA